MKNYFTISEFAKLRGININSLRYYEKLGLLKPAYVDERTGYRYYSAEQVQVLNKIILCINLGIPLKEMVEYIDEEGNLQSQKLLERGRSVAMQRMEQLQNHLNFIEASLKNIEASREFVGREGLYTRKLEERKIITTDYYAEYKGAKEILLEVSKIYKTAQENDWFPVLPAGQILEIGETGQMRYCFFLEIMTSQTGHPSITSLPAGNYSCLQVNQELGLDLMEPIGESPKQVDLQQLIRKYWGEAGKITVIVDNVALDKYSFETRASELQKLE